MVREIIRSKVALLGDDKIGKTKLLSTFMQSAKGEDAPWNNHYLMTVEVDLQIVTVNIPDTNYAVELQVFDFGGNQRLFHADNLQRKYLQLADHVIAAYDISTRSTFDSLKSSWLKQFKSTHISNNEQKYSGVVLALQSDLSQYSTVNPKEAIKLAQQYNCVAMKCSSKLAEDVDTPFNYIAQQVYLQHMNNSGSNVNQAVDNNDNVSDMSEQ
mmetsp:Transcript_35849/g.57632  ORF Transcript_35849/g.57632 Transcript_35849/m.57632 type:complete len:213 (-) Transcript_35849:360-998(-)